MIRVAILLRKLETGGAERQAIELAKGLALQKYDPILLTLYPGGALEVEARDAGLAVVCLGKRGRWDLLRFLWHLIATLRRRRIDIVHAFDGPPSLMALAARPFVPGMKSVWGVRTANVDPSLYDYSRGIVLWLVMRLASRADLVIANSRAGQRFLESKGVSPANIAVVHNGIDTARFVHDPGGRDRLRAQWALAPDQTLIGIVGRLDPAKDHETFLRAAARLAAREPKAMFVCVGDGPESARLRALPAAQELGERLIWAGNRTGMPAVYSALDLVILTSLREGFPNVLGEAMACGTPCVATDVGDCRDILGDTGAVVPVRQVDAIIEHWQRHLAFPTAELEDLRRRARRRIEENFSVAAMTGATSALYESLVFGGAGNSRVTPPRRSRQ